MEHLSEKCGKVNKIMKCLFERFHINYCSEHNVFYIRSQTLDRTMCEETVFWDLNYAMKYKSLVSENILKKVLKVLLTKFIWIDYNDIKNNVILTRRHILSNFEY